MTKDVLVIATDATLRRSLAFLFEAEGFAVMSHDSIPPQAPAAWRSRCAVVDDGALDFGKDGCERLLVLAETIVILISRTRILPGDVLIRTIEKPFLGAELVETVRSVLSETPNAP